MTVDEVRTLTHGQIVYHNSLLNSDGTSLRARIISKVKTWVREPNRVYVSVCHGLKDYAYITEKTCDQWLLTDPSNARELIEYFRRLENAFIHNAGNLVRMYLQTKEGQEVYIKDVAYALNDFPIQIRDWRYVKHHLNAVFDLVKSMGYSVSRKVTLKEMQILAESKIKKG
jgi:hypothetical protein